MCMTIDTQTFFSEMISTMGNLPFPATKVDVLNAARRSRASTEIKEAIKRLPETARFKSPQDVLTQLHVGTV